MTVEQLHLLSACNSVDTALVGYINTKYKITQQTCRARGKFDSAIGCLPQYRWPNAARNEMT